MQVWLIEVNMNPALHTNCATLRVLVPPLLCETLGLGLSLAVIMKITSRLCSADIAIEVFDKCRRNRPILPLNSASLFSILSS